jgi:hypothetical protein
LLAGEAGAGGDEVGGCALEDDPAAVVAAVVAGAGAEVQPPSRSASASPWLDLTSFEHYVWFSFAVVVTRRKRGSEELAQLTALFTRALIFASSVALNSFSA